MTQTVNFLKLAGMCSLFVAILHITIVFGGADWYRFFGAGEETALLVEQGSILPTISTIALALVFSGWTLYAWSGAGLLPRLPFLRQCLVLITLVYLTRGVAGFIVPFTVDHPRVAELSIEFWVWSSLICTGLGVVHLVGLVAQWKELP